MSAFVRRRAQWAGAIALVLALTVVLRAGAVYAITDRIKLDGALGVGVTRDSPDVLVTVGVTIALF